MTTLPDNDLAQKIKSANRYVYNNKTPEEYNKNESIFNEKRAKTCSSILNNASKNSGNAAYLDIGTGTGNLLRLATHYFRSCIGLDIGDNLLGQVKNQFPECHFVGSDAEKLPFTGENLNCISCYALLHHLLDQTELFKECYRVLKTGGTLYTDHDPNYYFNRFYHFYYKLRFSNQHGFGSEQDDLAEYHNVFTSGINPDRLKKMLLGIGFRDVTINYRMTDKENWDIIKRNFLKIIKTASKITRAKSLYTHFSIIAIK